MKKGWTRMFLVVLLLLAVVAVLRRGELMSRLNPEHLRRTIGQMGAGGPILYIFIYAIAPALLLPGFPLTLAAGLAFGPVWGTVYASIGSTLGASVAFLTARYLARDIIYELLGDRWKRLARGVAEKGWIYVALTRLIPVIPFNLLNYAFGLTGIRFLTYLWSSWLFMLPETAAFVLFGDALSDLVKGRIPPSLLIGLLLLMVVLLGPLIYRKWTGSKDALSR